jgi:MFS transporter, ACS family, glucarate transporter
MMDTSANKPAHALPSNVRWRIMTLIALSMVLTYLDRLNLSIAGKSIQDEFAISTQTMGWIFSAFLLGYALLQIPGGWAGDRFGARNVMTGAILGWSIFTAATAMAPQLPFAKWFGVVWSFLIVRFLVGVGEAASAPNSSKIVASWVKSTQRGIGSSFTIIGVGIGGAITPPLIAAIMQRWGWRASFYAAGAVGIVFAAIWRWYVTDSPEEHPGVNAAELAAIRGESGGHKEVPGGTTQKAPPTPWRRMLKARSTWGLLLGYMCQGFPIYFYHTWFFIYLVRVRHLSISESGLWGATPYIAISALIPLGGLYSDSVSRRLGRSFGRRLAVWTGMGLSAILLWAGSSIGNVPAAVSMLALGGGFNMFAAVTFWASCIDLSERHTGSLSGLMNTFGNLGGWLSPILTAYLASRFGWNRALVCAAAVTVASGLFFSLVDASESLDEPAAESTPFPLVQHVS